MRANLSRRIVSYMVDALPILFIVIGMHSLFVGTIITNSIENYDELVATYDANTEILQDELAALRTELDDELITEDEYTTQYDLLYESFITDNEEEYQAVLSNFLMTLTYGFVTFVSIYFIYMLILKGNSFGRKLMGIELTGKVRWYTIFSREVVWKHFFWVLFLIFITFMSTVMNIPFMVVGLFAFSGITFDVALIGFSAKKRTVRDMMSQTQVTYKGVNYPF